MHGTLNHLLATDRIWMKRFTGAGDAPERLDAILHEDFAGLRAAREAEDRRIVAWIDGLDDARLAGVIRYRRVSTPDEFVQELMPALDHWFNHQTHHRGQAHMILTGFGQEAPELDLLFYQREVAAGRGVSGRRTARRHHFSSQIERCRPGPGQRESQIASVSPSMP